MLETIDNNLKLLRMKEKLLKINEGVNDNDIVDYGNSAKVIDKYYYDKLVNKINSSLHNHSLEEEYTLLEEIDREYEQLKIFQCKVKDIYNKYSSKDIRLSNMDTINIENIRKRKEIISGYLVNLKNLEINKKEIEKLNEQLVIEDKRKDNIEVKLSTLESDLQSSFLSAEGRKYTDSMKSESTSVVSEYKSNGYDINELLNDNSQMQYYLSGALSERKEKEEVLKTAEICYNMLPSKENKEILDSLRLETIMIRYKLVLLKIASLISKKEKSYDEIKEKREKIVDLIKYRVSCLGYLKVRFLVDPFSRIKLNNQVEYLNSFSDNSKLLIEIRKKIASVSDKLDEMERKNIELIQLLDKEYTYINDNISMSDVDISEVELDSSESIVDENISTEIKKESKQVLPNQIVEIHNIPINFKVSRVIEKTSGVINRVNQMMNEQDSYNNTMSPEIVIESVSIPDKQIERDYSSLNLEEGSSSKNYSFDSFKDSILPDDNDFPAIDEALKLDDNKESTNNDKSDTTTDLFKEEVPFDGIKLFSDRLEEDESDKQLGEIPSFSINLDNSINNMNISKKEMDLTDIFPDMTEISNSNNTENDFWSTNTLNNNENNDSNLLDFDQQIDSLLNNNSGSSRRLAA